MIEINGFETAASTPVEFSRYLRDELAVNDGIVRALTVIAVNYERYRFLTIEKTGPIAVVTLNRPEARSALAAEGLDELESVWFDLARDGGTGWPMRYSP